MLQIRNGDVDVTLLKNTKAILKLKSDMGDIYSDFDMSKHKMVRKVDKEDSRAKGGKYKIKIENSMQVELNSGGPEMQLTTFNGDIYVRKGKWYYMLETSAWFQFVDSKFLNLNLDI